MKINKKIVISWLLVVLWMFAIFYLSSMNSELSNNKSRNTISSIIDGTVDTANSIGITDKHPSTDKINSIVNYLNLPLRKCMHSMVYFVLVTLLINVFYQMNVSIYKAYLYSILISFIYACSDEFHQLYVSGRTGQFSDVLIDTIGAIGGCLFFYLIRKLCIIVINRRKIVDNII